MSDPKEIPPHDLEAEVAVLGAMLLDPKAARVATSILGADDFYSGPHQSAFAVLDFMAQDDRPIDPVTFRDELFRKGFLESVGGTNFISRLAASVPSVANAAHYAKIVFRVAREREVWAASREYAEKSGNGHASEAFERLAVARAALEADPAPEVEAPWPDIMPLGAFPRPPFPVEALPPDLAEWSRWTASSLQVPVDLPAMLCLPVLAAAVARKFEVQIRPGWLEPLNLYCITAMPPGSRKSAAFAAATRIFYEFEAEQVERERAEHLREVANYEMLEKKVAATNAARAAAKDSAERNRAESAFQSAMKDFEDTPEPAAELRLVGDDVTPERVVGIMSEQKGRFAIFSAEGGMLNTLAGSRYSKTAMPSYDALLKAHAGDPISHDRKGAPLVRVQHPALTLGLCVQPEILRGLAAAPGAHGVGLLARFLYSIPFVDIGSRTIRSAPTPPDVAMNYRRVVGKLLELPMREEPVVLKMTCYADDAIATFEEEIESRIGPDGDLVAMVEWVSKLAGATSRIACLIALAESDPEVPIEYVEVDHVERAIRIGRYLLSHARAAMGVAETFPEIAIAERILAWADRRNVREFSTRDALMAMRGGGATIQRAEQIRPAIEVLLETGHIRSQQIKPTGRSGRPYRDFYKVRPRAVPADDDCKK